MTLSTCRLAVLLLLTGALLVAGCNGVQAGQGERVRDCDSIKKFTDVKVSMDTVDRKIQNLRPDTITADSLKGLVDDYRKSEATYQGLLGEATAELDRSRSQGAALDLVEAWDVLRESLTQRRDGIRFFADAFSDPAKLADPSFNEKGQEFLRKEDDVNLRLQADVMAMLEARGFKQREDGQFVIDC